MEWTLLEIFLKHVYKCDQSCCRTIRALSLHITDPGLILSTPYGSTIVPGLAVITESNLCPEPARCTPKPKL